MKAEIPGDDIVLKPNKGLLSIRLPKKTVADAFAKLVKRGTVTRISYQDEAGHTSVRFTKGARKKVAKITEELREEYFAGKSKSKDKKKDKDKKHK